ncbi:hypothetical protein DVT68_08350 [Dyella solisilvae]|uniref:Uncharacterized protein n=1 Tax=Dyella solisilvae TaxID=1920168 RepID=A0A370K7C4_9GAMM|nr:hypothetical protein [Dyella solisilvae]RDI98532.1 hypothetical protein DVT68_08350 [Dyella solisilvae]
MAVRSEYWTWDVKTTIGSGGGSMEFVLVTKIGQDANAELTAPDRPHADPEGEAVSAKLGWHKAAMSTVAGQACRSWRSDQGAELCLWDGQGKWDFGQEGGYPRYPTALCATRGDIHYDCGGVPILRAVPAQGGEWSITTLQMTVGEHFDDAVFAMPAASGMDSQDASGP